LNDQCENDGDLQYLCTKPEMLLITDFVFECIYFCTMAKNFD